MAAGDLYLGISYIKTLVEVMDCLININKKGKETQTESKKVS